jgi:hypothetical protein
MATKDTSSETVVINMYNEDKAARSAEEIQSHATEDEPTDAATPAAKTKTAPAPAE